MPLESDWSGLVQHGLLASVLGAVGRLLFLAKATSRPKGWQLLWEVPLAVGLGLVGISIAGFLETINSVSYGIIIAVAYLGPQIIDKVAEVYFRKNKLTDKT